LSDRSGHYLYPPAVLPSAQGAYFVESTFPLSMKERTIKLSPPHTPWFLLELPPYAMVGNRLISQKDGLVYDVIDEGTYISRRARHDDLIWAPFSPGGTVAVTRYTVELKPLLNITYDRVEDADTGLDVLVHSGLKNERCLGFFSKPRAEKELYLSTEYDCNEQYLLRRLVEDGWGVSSVFPVSIIPLDPLRAFRLVFRGEDQRVRFSKEGPTQIDGMVIRQHKVLTFMEHPNLLVSVSFVTRAYVHVPDNTGGKVHLCYHIDHCGVRGYFLPAIYGSGGHLFTGNVVSVFLSQYDYQKYRSRLLEGDVKWVCYSSNSVGLYGKNPMVEPTLSSAVHQAVQRANPKTWSDPGVSLAEIRSFIPHVGIDDNKLRVLFRGRMSAICWHASDGYRFQEWVGVTSVDVVFPGPARIGFIDGMRFSDVYSRLMVTKAGYLKYGGPSHDLIPFLRVLEMNSVVTTVTHRPMQTDIDYVVLLR